jgi:hypothetical protein
MEFTDTVSVAACSVDITPTGPMPMAGYELRGDTSPETDRPLEANILVLRTEAGTYHVVSIDAIYGGELRHPIGKRLGCSPDDVLVLGSHTHFAPGVDRGIPMLGATDDAYIDEVADRIAGAILHAAPNGAPSATVEFGMSRVDPGLFMNRRRPTLGAGFPLPRFGRVVTAPHPRGATDPFVRCALLRDEVREPIALLWGAACHPVCSPTPDQMGPCFPGVLREDLRTYLGLRGLPVLFAQGFSADIRPGSMSRRPPRGRGNLADFTAAGFMRFVPQEQPEYERWCGRLAEACHQALHVAGHTDGAPLKAAVSKFRQHPAGWERPVEGTAVSLSEQVSLVAVNAEVPSERVSSLNAVAPHVIPAGCADEVMGYWPTDRMLRMGGYEGRRSQRFFPPVDWAAETPDVLWQGLIDGLSQSNGRSGGQAT